MKILLRSALAFALASTVSPAVLAQSTTASVDKVRYCRSIWPVCNDTTDHEYRFWPEAGVDDSTQKQTWISRYNEPPVEKTEHLVFLAAGTRLGDEADPSLVTGQSGWEHHAGREHQFNNAIQDPSLAYQLFQRGIYSRENTFVGLGFDSRYRGGMEEATLDRIVEAHYRWLRSKFDPARLKTVYLGGHSRSGVLAIRLARRFKADFPAVPVIVDAFDPVARTSSFGAPNSGPDRDDMGVYTESIDNPTVPYPRNTGGLNDKGNWSWKTNLREQFPIKTDFYLSNYINGGRMPQQGMNFAQETRSFTLDTGTSQFTDLGWLYQEWRWVGSESDGHVGIAQDAALMSQALDRLAARLDGIRRNIAPQASATASSAACGGGMGGACQAPSYANDRNLDSRAGYGWAPDPAQPGPSWLELRWPSPIDTDRVQLVGIEGQPLQSFELQYLGPDGTWTPVEQATGRSRQGVTDTIPFAPVRTQAIRVANIVGPGLGEVLVWRGDARNLATSATASAYSTFSGYSPGRVNDGDFSSALGGGYSWVNDGYPLESQWLQLTWPEPVTSDQVDVTSSDGYALAGFKVQYLDDGAWKDVSGAGYERRDAVKTAVTFAPVTTAAMRLVGFSGPAHQPQYFRVNEFAVREAAAIPPNLAPEAGIETASTYPGYSAAKAIDGVFDTRLGPEYSWSNAGYESSPPWLELSWARPVSTGFVEVHSSDGYALQGFDLEYWDGQGWARVQSRATTTLGPYSAVTFTPVTTHRLRLVNFVGPPQQLYFYRVNELAVYGRYAD